MDTLFMPLDPGHGMYDQTLVFSVDPLKSSSNANVHDPETPVGTVVCTVGAGNVTVDVEPSAAMIGMVTLMRSP
jgi:hypothetical protein